MFDGFDPEKYADEARAKWGATDSFKESARRTKSYGKPEWDAIKSEADCIYRRFADLMQEGAPPSRCARARCRRGTPRAHQSLVLPVLDGDAAGPRGDVRRDPRFTENIDKYGGGLSQFIHAAVTGASGIQKSRGYTRWTASCPCRPRRAGSPGTRRAAFRARSRSTIAAGSSCAVAGQHLAVDPRHAREQLRARGRRAWLCSRTRVRNARTTSGVHAVDEVRRPSRAARRS